MMIFVKDLNIFLVLIFVVFVADGFYFYQMFYLDHFKHSLKNEDHFKHYIKMRTIRNKHYENEKKKNI